MQAKLVQLHGGESQEPGSSEEPPAQGAAEFACESSEDQPAAVACPQTIGSPITCESSEIRAAV